MKRLLICFLTTAMVLTQLPVISFADERAKEVEEINIYRKTSRTPSEDRKNFNGMFHTSEPLGLEVLRETKVDILISGNKISGQATLKLHDVARTQFIANIPVGEKVTVTIPRKGELFLDVANVKYDSDNSSDDFDFDVDVTFNKSDYKVTPTFDTRKHTISDKNNLTEEEFLDKALSDSNKEDGALMISDNVRIYIPVSKYVSHDLDPDKVLARHEETIEMYNKLAGLDENAPDLQDRPRENFVLVSARDNHVGSMSAGNEMLDTGTRNIGGYLRLNGHWGQSHEYGHKYESGWGYQEYWCNVFANMMQRKLTNNPKYNWSYGTDEKTFVETKAKPIYENYFKEGKIGTLHPLYYWLSFVDRYDKDYIAKMSRFYKNVPYGGAEYVAYFAAKNYGINIIPYLEMSGEKIKNISLIKDIIESTNKTYIYIPDYVAMNEVKGISFPPTIVPIYTGKNREVIGMSNPNSEITVDINGNKFNTKTDENGKFKLPISNDIKAGDKISVASKETGKKQSFFKDVNILDENARISFKGYGSKEFLSLKFDDETKKFVAKSSGETIHSFQGDNYVIIEHYNKKGKLKNKFSVNGYKTADEVAEQMNKTMYIDGDYLKIYHKEQYSRLSMDGEIINSPFVFNTGVKNINPKNSYFYIMNGKLTYSTERLNLEENRGDLKELLADCDYKEGNYTKASWKNYINAKKLAETIVDSNEAGENDISIAYSVLENSIKNLRKLNKIEFRGYNKNLFLELSFDSDKKVFKAKTNNEIANPYLYSREYATITHFDKKGNVKGKYTIRANETGATVAEKLNNLKYVEGDYLKLSHAEPYGRLIVDGYVKNSPYDLDNGVKNLDLNSSLFYLTGESLEYSDKVLDLSANKEDLIAEIEKAKSVTNDGKYTEKSYEKLQDKIIEAEVLVNAMNVTEDEINNVISAMSEASHNLRELNSIEFKGYNNVTFLTLKFDAENNKLIAKSNGKMVHPYQSSREYIRVTHFDQKGNSKGSYAVRANETADKMAESLNGVEFVKGDYLKLNHIEKNNRLVIKGYVENAPYDLSTGGRNLDLPNSYFYFGEDNFIYSDKQLDLSDDKTELISKIDVAKNIDKTSYTKTTVNNLENVIKKGEELVKATNVTSDEINAEISNIDKAISELRENSLIEFRGYGNNKFLKVWMDTESNTLKAESNGERVHNSFNSSVYATLTHYDKKGNKKAEYSVKGGETADKIAGEINGSKYEDGDYLKLYHREPNGRLVIKGYVENSPYDLSTGGRNLDLSNSYFYLGGESLKYSDTHLDLSDNKSGLIEKVKEVKALNKDEYTKTSYSKFNDVVVKADNLIKLANATKKEIDGQIEELNKAVKELRKVNVIEFKGYNNVTFLALKFDTENNKLIAESNGKMVHPYQSSREYIRVTHFDQKGNSKGSYAVRANETADKMAKSLNGVEFVKGDYLKLNHIEKNNRLVINGYVENAPYDLSTGGRNLDLSNSYFYLGEEDLKYSNEHLDLSADKTLLINKINEVEKIKGDNYTKTSYKNLLNVIALSEKLVEEKNILESEINLQIGKLNKAVEELKEINLIEFKGYNNEIFLTLGFDKVNNKFIAKSNGKMVHPYHYSKIYSTVYHYDKAGNLKGEYSVRANETADKMAEELNKATIEKGDYIKLNHIEQNSRLVIKGHINNLEQNISNGVGSLNLSNTKLNLDDENLSYVK